MSNISKLDGILAVEDLTDAAATVVEGGGSDRGKFNFDFLYRTKTFSVSRGGDVDFASRSSKGGNPGTFLAVLRSAATGKATAPQPVTIGVGNASWDNVRGGNYRIELSDRKDSSFIGGTYTTSFS